MVDVFSQFQLDGSTAVVTGASSGLGMRFVRVLHAAGATVIASARRTSRLEKLAQELGKRVIPITCDVTSDVQVERLVEQACALGNDHVNILVNNAGISNVSPAETESSVSFRQVVDVNLNALFVVSQAFGKVMLTQGAGSIVNIGSILGLVAGSPIKQAAYCASKAGVLHLTRELAVQWAQRGVRVNAIAPGYFPSEMTVDLWNNEKSVNYVRRSTPMGRGGLEHELDGALLFLVSPASSYVTGQTVVVDGGWTSH